MYVSTRNNMEPNSVMMLETSKLEINSKLQIKGLIDNAFKSTIKYKF